MGYIVVLYQMKSNYECYGMCYKGYGIKWCVGVIFKEL